jgi:hypothetical protein
LTARRAYSPRVLDALGGPLPTSSGEKGANFGDGVTRVRKGFEPLEGYFLWWEDLE